MQPLGAPAESVQTFIEVPFHLGDGKFFPDGLIRVSRGQRPWTALVEVKTGSNELHAEQLERYLDIAREQGFDALITISNEIPPIPGQHPTAVDKRKLKKVALHHMPWSEVLTAAVMQKEYRGVADPDQAWVLGELIRYLEHPRSGALEFSDMGPRWVSLRDAVGAGTLRATDAAAAEIAGRFDALVRFAGLKLGRQLGTEILPRSAGGNSRSPPSAPKLWSPSWATTGTMSAALRIPGAVGVARRHRRSPGRRRLPAMSMWTHPRKDVRPRASTGSYGSSRMHRRRFGWSHLRRIRGDPAMPSC